MKSKHLIGTKQRLLALMLEAGWPKSIGLNDKRKVCHNHLSLDNQPVDTFWAKGAGFFALDREFGIVTCGDTRDAALIAMVNARESAAPLRSS